MRREIKTRREVDPWGTWCHEHPALALCIGAALMVPGFALTATLIGAVIGLPMVLAGFVFAGNALD